MKSLTSMQKNLQSQPAALSEAVGNSERAIRLPIDWFDRRNGLPTSQIHEIAFSSDGRLWAATPAGLLCYDGVRTRHFGRDEGLLHHGLRAVAIDADDRLWVGSDAGLQRLKIEGSSLVPLEWDAIGLVESIAITADRSALATPQGLMLAAKQSPYARSSYPRIAYSPFASVAANSAGSILATSPLEGALIISPDGTVRPILGDGNADLGKIHVAIWATDTLLMLGGDNGMALIDEDGQLLGSMKCQEPVTALIWDEGSIWAGIGNSVFNCRLEKGEIQIVGRAFSGVRVNGMTKDHFGNIWMATDSSGIARLSCLRSVVSYPDAPEIGAILSIRKHEDGAVLAGTSGFSLDGKTVLLPGVKVWDVIEDAMGAHWAATEKGLHIVVNRNLVTPVHQTCLTLAAPCRVLAIFGGGLLVGSIRGLVRTGPDGPVEINKPDGHPLGYVYSIHVDASGIAWVATLGAGLWQYDGEDLTQISGGSLPEACNVYAIAEDEAGMLFVAHDNCISRLRPEHEPKLLWKTRDAVAAWALCWTAEGRLLAGSSRGLFVFDAVTGEFLRELYDPSGTNNWEFTTSRSLTLDDSDTILCGLACGLAKVSYSRFAAWETKPGASLDSIRWIGTEPAEGTDTPVVEEGRWRVEFGIRTNWYVDEAVCTMRYRLLGFDSHWTGFVPIAAITYSSLPPGTYTLEVELRSPIAGIGPTRALHTFEVRGKLSAFAHRLVRMLPESVGRNGFYARLSRARLDRKKRELEQMVRIGTIELQGVNEKLKVAHDELNILAHSDPLTGIANRRSFERAFDAAFERASATAGNLSVIMIDIDHFKRYNDHYGHAGGDEVLKRVGEALKCGLRRTDDMFARIGGEEFAILLPNADAKSARRVAERVNLAVRALNIPHGSSPTADCITISAGVASFNAKTENKDALIAEADQQLYRAKAAGRDRWSPRRRKD
jgi:diguanylate cyclase (GGDEF)-like protein